MDETMFADGFDEAIMGVVWESFPEGRRVVYDRSMMIEILSRTMDYEEAVEFFDFNIEGAYVGKGTPLYLEVMTKEEIKEHCDA